MKIGKRSEDRSYRCKSQPKRYKPSNDVNRFRWTNQWKMKSKQIRERDKYLCQICLLKQYNTVKQYNFTNLEVHHIEPLIEAWDKRLEDSNLISLCAYHHKMADSGQIPKIY
jgi:5-methylcytosine-specific restriction enzyme A